MKFGKPDPVKTQEKKNIEENAKIAADESIAHAQKCLRDPEFIKYKEACERLKDNMIEELVYLDEMVYEPVLYGFKCKDIVSKYRHISAMMRAVEGEAGK